MFNILLSVNVILFLVMGNFLLAQRKYSHRLEEQYQELKTSIEQTLKDHPVLIKADLSFSRQLREINSQLISMDTQMQDLENVRDNDGGYQHALRILEMGGNREEIINSCHLSPAAAELLMNLQAYRSAIKAN